MSNVFGYKLRGALKLLHVFLLFLSSAFGQEGLSTLRRDGHR